MDEKINIFIYRYLKGYLYADILIFKDLNIKVSIYIRI